MARRRQRLPKEPVEAAIESLSHDGRGIAHVEGKAVFIHGALPGERVMFRYTARKRSHDEGEALEILQAAPQRVEPKCPHYDACGGCSLQHMAPEAQIAAKQQTLLDNLQRIGGVTPEDVLPPLTGPHWGYRRKARLGVKYVPKKGKVLVGFRERRSPYVTDMQRCEVLDEGVGLRLEEIGAMIHELEARARIPQIEVAVGDEATTLVFRHLDPLSAGDRERLLRFARETGFQVALQPKGPDTVTPLWPEQQDLFYRLPAHEVSIHFKPVDFTQVNMSINRKMVDLAIELLDPQPHERVLDLFAGLGNFTLPIARRAKEVVGIEGDEMMVKRGHESALRNGIDNTRHHACNLFEDVADEPWMHEAYDKVLLDPPRAGAIEMIPHVAAMVPGRIVYVSCHPGTLARDAGELVNTHSYRLVKAGVMDMFPHTAHVESIAVFERR